MTTKNSNLNSTVNGLEKNRIDVWTMGGQWGQ